jgi:hypothetical protein
MRSACKTVESLERKEMICQVLKIPSLNMSILAGILNVSRQTIYNVFKDNLERNHIIRPGHPKIITSEIQTYIEAQCSYPFPSKTTNFRIISLIFNKKQFMKIVIFNW